MAEDKGDRVENAYGLPTVDNARKLLSLADQQLAPVLGSGDALGRMVKRIKVVSHQPRLNPKKEVILGSYEPGRKRIRVYPENIARAEGMQSRWGVVFCHELGHAYVAYLRWLWHEKPRRSDQAIYSEEVFAEYVRCAIMYGRGLTQRLAPAILRRPQHVFMGAFSDWTTDYAYSHIPETMADVAVLHSLRSAWPLERFGQKQNRDVEILRVLDSLKKPRNIGLLPALAWLVGGSDNPVWKGEIERWQESFAESKQGFENYLQTKFSGLSSLPQLTEASRDWYLRRIGYPQGLKDPNGQNYVSGLSMQIPAEI